MGVLVAIYRSLALLIIFVVSQVVLLGVSDYCVEKPIPVPFPHKYIYLKYYGMDCISFMEVIRVVVYKSLLLVAHTVTALLLY